MVIVGSNSLVCCYVESEKLLDSNRLVKDEESVETPAVIQWQFDEAMEKVGFGKYQFFLWGE